MFRAFSMIIGRIAPQAQTNLKRLLAYSSVGHMGLLLIPQCRNNLIENTTTQNTSVMNRIPGDSIGVLWAYMLIYAIINIGCWSLLLWPMYRPVSVFSSAISGKTWQRQTQTGNGSRRATDARPGEVYAKAEHSKISTSYRGSLSRRDSPQFLWDLKGLNTSSARAAFRWAVFMACQAGLPPAYSFQGKAAILWNAVNNGLFILTAVAQIYTMIGAVYYQKVMKITYVDNPETWRSYAKVSPITAYIIAISVAVMLIGQWYGNSLFLYTHLLALSASNKNKYIFF